jgi:predicted outer membrane repeat protein
MVMLAALLAAGGTAAGRIIYVDDDANVGGDGQTWGTAYKHLQDGLAAASSGDEVWVAEGVYRPDEDRDHPDGTGERTASFQLKNGVAVSGGYAGFGEPDPNARNVGLYQTILSGDLSGDDPNDLNPQDLWGHPNRVENSYHLVVGSGTDQTAIIDGFTITGGNANRFEDVNDSGAGMYNDFGSPTVINCKFTRNSAGNDGLGGGGGMLNYQSDPTLVNCIFVDNAADDDCTGGGMFNHYSDPLLKNCTFSRNVAEYCGGGMHNVWSNPTLTNCTFTENFVSHRGGAIHNDYGSFQSVLTSCTFTGNVSGFEGGAIYNVACDSVTLTNCVFNMNSAGRHGGGIYNDHANSTLTNCVFTGNLASTGGGVYVRGYRTTNTMTLTNCTFSGNSSLNGNAVACDSFRQQYPIILGINNCILWGDPSHIWNNDGSTIAINYTDVQGGQAAVYDPCEAVIWGQGNIDADPCLVEPGYWDANGTPSDPNDDFWVEGDYHLLPSSPCIDAGDNNSVPADTADLDGDGDVNERIPWDLDGDPRICDGDDDGNSVVDMGAYEFVPPVEVALRFTPQAVNPGSKGKWVKAHFILPEGYVVEDVDANRPARITEPFEPDIESEYMDVFVNDANLVEIEAVFERGEFCGAGIDGETLEVTVVGSFTTGQKFYGTETIKITKNYLKYVADLASYWLAGDCGKPDWCGGVDLDQNSRVDFVDFALFEGCCVEVVAD